MSTEIFPAGQIFYRSVFFYILLGCVLFFYSTGDSRVVGKNPRAGELGEMYDIIPNGNIFLTGMYLVDITSIIALPANWLQCMSLGCFHESKRARKYLYGIIGTIDLIIAFLLLSGVVMEEQFLPSTLSGCGDAVNWNNATDGRNYFVVANTTGSFPKTVSPAKICTSMLNMVIMAMVYIIFFSACATYNLSVFFSDLAGGEESSDMLLSAIDDAGCLGCLAFPCGTLVPFVLLFAYIYNHTMAPVRFVFRYAFRYLGHFSTSAIPLQPTLDKPRRHSCDQLPNKATCFICENQVCSECQEVVKIPQSEAHRHLVRCRAACSRCYYEDSCVFTLSRRSRRKRHHTIFDVEVMGGASNKQSDEIVCQECAAASATERERVLEKRDTDELQRLARLPLACFQCKAMLPEIGPRWWLDVGAGEGPHECSWKSHPRWITHS
ncbi:hypothetical protein QBC38DRAFT_264759 [Podospora fimiseda]|uniref:Uncharacterized protein n=1 Tax=Podospora fimiseda TaxID=252190 RepID=A0AAN7GV00_9PEZI|nr:hypothetical protein QBC38DRAFT_264759 [Podospora fimiseda]